jgi:hypothetical protein
MQYYTNVANVGNHILVRGIENGKRVNHRNPYKPTLYIKENRKKVPTTSKWKNLQGQALEPLKFDNIYEARAFTKKYEGVQNFTIYGQQQYQYAYIAEYFGKKVKFDPTDIVLATIDIEVGNAKYHSDHKIKVRRKSDELSGNIQSTNGKSEE